MSYYCHECTQRRNVLYNPLSCAICGSEMIDSIPIVDEESSEDEELQEFFSEIDFYYNALAREQVQDDADFSTFDDDDDQYDDDEEALEERCLFEQLSSMYNHPTARNFTITNTSTDPFPPILRPDSPPTIYRHLADRLYQELYEEAEQDHEDDDDDDDDEEEEEEEVTEDEDILSYTILFEQRTMNDNNELEQPDTGGTWEAVTLPQSETESLFHLPFDRFGSLLDAMYSYRSDDESDDESVEGDSSYHRRSFLDNLADILSDYTSEVRQQQTPTTPATIVDAIVKSLKRSCLDSSDPVAHDECIICQEVYGTSIDIFQLPCQHKYHAICITKWFNVNTSCPICRHPADEQQQQEQSSQAIQERHIHSTQSTTSTDSSISLPSTAFLAGRTNVFDLGDDQYETDSDQSETVSHTGEQNRNSFEDIASGLLPSGNAVHAGISHNIEETGQRYADSDQESMGSFERSIASILSPRTLDTISSSTPSRRNNNRYFHSPPNPMDEFISSQFQASRSRNTENLYDENASDGNMNNPAVMDWWYNSSMEEVD